MGMKHEERMHLAETVFEKVPEQVTRRQKKYFATMMIVMLRCYRATLKMEERREKRKKSFLSEGEIDQVLYQRILANCDEIWHPEQCNENPDGFYMRARRKLLE